MLINRDEQIERARQLLAEGKDLDTAEGIFNAFLNIDQTSPILWFYLASVQMRKQHFAHAKILLNKSLELDSTSVYSAHTWNNLGFIYRYEQQDNLAIDAFTKATELNKQEPDFIMNLGSMFVGNGTPDKAISYFENALKLDKNHQQTHWNLGLALLEKCEFGNGFKEYDSGHRTQEKEERYYYPNNMPPTWDGTKGQTVIVYGEQGIGDEIMFASILKCMEKDCTIIFDAHPRLADIFRRSFPEITVFGTRKDKQFYWPNLISKVDAKIAIGSIPKFYRKKHEDFPRKPYLIADPVLVEKYKKKLEKLGDKPKIGISWKGGTKETGLKNRTIKLEQFIPIFKAIDADFISLQYTENAQKELDDFENVHKIKVHHWQDTIDDYDETAGLVSNLDLIISVPQSVVHLAGALGTQTIQLTPKKALWQMGTYGEDMPWYGHVLNVWQDDSCTWEPVIEKAKDMICNLSPTTISI